MSATAAADAHDEARSPRVVVVGSLNADLVVTTARLPEPGETVLGSDVQRFAGGKGLNQAVAASRAGAVVVMVGAVGDDDTGPWLQSILRDEGIDARHCHVASGPSGTALIEVDAAGRNRIIVVPGANDALTEQQAAAALADQPSRTVVLAQGETPVATVRAAFAVARERGLLTILNPAPVRDFPDDLLALVDLLIPNEHEAAELSGLPTDSVEACVAAAHALIARGPQRVLITRGAEGALLVDATSSVSVPTYPVVPIDTVAAGDAFCGALAAALAEGADLHDAIRTGCAAGALATTTAGAVPSLPSRQAVADMRRTDS